jgi:hypothetical protein
LSADSDVIILEIDRQLADVRTAADGLAIRAGVLFAAAGAAAALFAPTVHRGQPHEEVLIGAVILLL